MILRLGLILAIASFTIQGHPIYLAKREQPDVPETPPLDLRPLEWGDVNFIHTTDIHGWLEGHLAQPSYNGDLGDFYSFTLRMKQKAQEMRKDLFIVDTGDTHDGNGLSDVTNPHGSVTQPMLTNIPYDLLSIGNHELYVDDVTEDVYRNFMPHWQGRYLAANVYFRDVHNNKTVTLGDKYAYFEGEFGTRVLALGFLFDFAGYGSLSIVRKVEDEIKEPWFTQALESHTPDVIVLFGHIGLRMREFYIIIQAIRQHFPKMPIAVLGGHTHIRDFVVYDPWAAGIESGRYLETVGFFSINGIHNSRVHLQQGHQELLPSTGLTFHRRYLDQNRKTFIFHSTGNEETFDTALGLAISQNITVWRERLGISERFGCAPQDYYLSAVPPDHPNSLYHLVSNEILPKIVLDKERSAPAYFIMNSGSHRFDVYRGNFTLDTVYQVSPFVDPFYYIPNVPYGVAQNVFNRLNQSYPGLMQKRSLWEDLVLGTPIPVQTTFKSHDATLTPGYTTVDDLGSDGDDTRHTPIPYYDAGVYVSADMVSPSASETDLVDLVFNAFVWRYLQSAIKVETGKYWEYYPYGRSDITTSSMWSEYAETHWYDKC